MLRPARLFGVRRGLNRVIDFLNDSMVEDDWVQTVDEKLNGARDIIGILARIIITNNRKIQALEDRVKALDNWKQRRMAVDLLRSSGQKIDEETNGFILEAMEGLDARLTNLEYLLFPEETGEPISESKTSEAEESSETNLPDTEEAVENE